MTKVSSEAVSIHMHDRLCINSEIIEKSVVKCKLYNMKTVTNRQIRKFNKGLKATRRQTRQTMNIEFSEVKRTNIVH